MPKTLGVVAHSPSPGAAEVETGSSLRLIGQLAWPTRPVSVWAQEKDGLHLRTHMPGFRTWND